MKAMAAGTPQYMPGERIRLAGTEVTGTVRRVWIQENIEWQYVVTWDDGGPGLTTTAAFLAPPTICRAAQS
jgi:hypothetical protein